MNILASIIVPVYNEQETIISVLEKINKVFNSISTFEIIVVNDCSNDKTENALLQNPTLYNKLINNKINAYVRYLDFDIKTNFKKFQIDLIKSKYLCKKKLGSGEISLINSNDAFKFGFSKLELNNNYFLNNSPTFKKNKLPLI